MVGERAKDQIIIPALILALVLMAWFQLVRMDSLERRVFQIEARLDRHGGIP